MRYGLLLGVLSLSAFVIGCGEETVEVQPPPQGAAAKKMLEDLAQTGQPMGSGGMEIQHEIERIKATDPTKAEKLQADFNKLVSMKNPAQIKATAKAMAAEM